jgi:hypothetical protein
MSKIIFQCGPQEPAKGEIIIQIPKTTDELALEALIDIKKLLHKISKQIEHETKHSKGEK